MERNEIRDGVTFGFGLLFAACFIWLGIKFFGLVNDTFTPTTLFLFGVSSVLAGVFMVKSAEDTNWTVSLSMIAFGFYLFARSAGVINISIAAIILGGVCLLGAATLVYMTFPGRK